MKKITLSALILASSFLNPLFAKAEISGPLPIEPKDVVHYFNFRGNDGEASGFAVEDLISYKNNLIPRTKNILKIRSVPEIKDYGVKFDDTTGYGQILDSNYQLMQEGTIAANINIERCGADKKSYRAIAARYSSLRNQRGFIFGINSSCQLALITSSDGKKVTIAVSSTKAVSLNKTIHVALRLRVGGEYAFFIDGLKAGEGILPDKYKILFGSRAPLTVGAVTRSSTLGDMRFHGSIAHLLLAKRPLEKYEIAMLNNASKRQSD